MFDLNLRFAIAQSLALSLRRAALGVPEANDFDGIVFSNAVNDADGIVDQLAHVVAAKLGNDAAGSGKTAGLLGAMITF